MFVTSQLSTTACRLPCPAQASSAHSRREAVYKEERERSCFSKASRHKRRYLQPRSQPPRAPKCSANTYAHIPDKTQWRYNKCCIFFCLVHTSSNSLLLLAGAGESNLIQSWGQIHLLNHADMSEFMWPFNLNVRGPFLNVYIIEVNGLHNNTRKGSYGLLSICYTPDAV